MEGDPEPIPLGAPGQGVPVDHVSFNEFWSSLGFPGDPEHERLRELFFEWLGQQRFDVHDRDEPTVLGDLGGWREAWARYLRLRRLK